MNRPRNIILNTIIVSVISIVAFVLVIYSSYIMTCFFNSQEAVSRINIFKIYFSSLLFPFWIFGITYKLFWEITQKISMIKTSALIFFFIALWFAGYKSLKLAFHLNDEILKLYDYIALNENARGTEGIIYQSDDTLGYKPIPFSKGFHLLGYGSRIPTRFDKNGFRIPVCQDSVLKFEPDKKTILFLGCSFTYGDACYSEDTFSYIAAKKLNYNYINAGVCGYGLSQMYILANKLIPKYRPDFVVIQYSPWLWERSNDPLALSYIGLLPNPYFYSAEKNSLKIEYPLFTATALDLDKKILKEKYKNNYTGFYIKEGIQFVIKDYFNLQKVSVPENKPCRQRITIENFAYKTIFNLTFKEGGTPILLSLGEKENTEKPEFLLNLKDKIIFADADSFLFDYLSKSETKIFNKEFQHWIYSNDTIRLIDKHPNPKAHKIIAESIISAIKKSENK